MDDIYIEVTPVATSIMVLILHQAQDWSLIGSAGKMKKGWCMSRFTVYVLYTVHN